MKLEYWGKTREQDGVRHPLAYHSLDVAATTHAIVMKNERLWGVLSEMFDMTREELALFLAFLASLHDIGKFSPAFQNKLSRISLPGMPYDPLRHDGLSRLLMDKAYDALLDIEDGKNADQRFVSLANIVMSTAGNEDGTDNLITLMMISMGHHGAPPEKNKNNIDHVQYFNEYWPAAFIADVAIFVSEMNEFFGEMLAKVSSKSIPGLIQSVNMSKVQSWMLAGLLTMSDWIGSTVEWFPFETTVMSTSEYWVVASINADRALATLELDQKIQNKCFNDLFPEYIPSNVQRVIIDNLAMDSQQKMVIVEEITGGGKTEAGIALAGGSNFFFALPTLATANGLWSRLKSLEGQKTLSHGRVKMFPGAMEDANHWFHDVGRKALLTPIGAGTVDQVMLAAMFSRYSGLRLVGLAGKTLIIDEVHAYDEYMVSILCSLIGFQARMKGSVVLLSATLPTAHRKKYVEAWRRACGQTSPTILKDKSFPLITSVGNDGSIREIPVANGHKNRLTKFEFSSDVETIKSCLIARSKKGQTAAWFRNTVGEAVSSYNDLKEMGIPVILFHSRMTIADRHRVETEVMRCFGKSSTHERQRNGLGLVLITTQVAEQSLDIDFDFVVSDLCPIDLLFQRLGREHRHDRGNRGEMVMMIHAPEWHEKPTGNWVVAWSPGTNAVYPRCDRLWNTMRYIMSKDNRVALPDDLREAIEFVYSETADIPDGMAIEVAKAQGKSMELMNTGKDNSNNCKSGYTLKEGYILSDLQAPTRIGDPVRDVILFDETTQVPINDTPDMSTISLRKILEISTFDGIGRFGKFTESLPMKKTADGWVGRMTKNGKPMTVKYSAVFGFEA